MDEGKEKLVDRLSDLPDFVLCQVLLNLGTKDVVRTSVLSPRWRNLWTCVPGLDLKYDIFLQRDTFMSFVDSFLGFNSESPLESFRLAYNFPEYADKCEFADMRRWINTAIERKVKHIKQLEVLDGIMWTRIMHIPDSIYTCESLVTLELYGMTVASPKFISLPCLKAISLDRVIFLDVLDLEKLILSSRVLEKLVLCKRFSIVIGVVRVSSQSLVYFSLIVDPVEVNEDWEKDTVVTIDAHRLEYLELSDHRAANFIVQICGSLLKANIDSHLYISSIHDILLCWENVNFLAKLLPFLLYKKEEEGTI